MFFAHESKQLVVLCNRQDFYKNREENIWCARVSPHTKPCSEFCLLLSCVDEGPPILPRPPPSPPLPASPRLARLLTDAHDLLSFDYTSLPTDVESTVTISPSASGTMHAVAIWVDYELDETSRWSTFGGGRGGGEPGRRGGVHEKQMLRFLSKPVEVGGSGAAAAVLMVSGRFDVEGGSMSFDVVEPS